MRQVVQGQVYGTMPKQAVRVAANEVSMAPVVHHVQPGKLMTFNAAQDFRAVSDELTMREQAVFDELARSASKAAQLMGRHWDFTAPARAADQEIDRVLAPVSETDKQRLRRAFVARVCLTRVGQFSQRLPESVLSLYPRFYERIARYLRLSQTYSFDDHAKDVRYALNMTVPAGMMEVDLESRVGPKLVLRNLRSLHGLSSALSYVRHKSWGTWYSRHLDLRGKPDFTPEGWTDCFQRCAEMLRLNRTIRGVQGVSWYYDPALDQVSPHLSYIRKTQVENGAFLVRIGPGEEYTRRATLKSRTRRQLVEEGTYLPTCYAVIWPRENLMAWAERTRRDPLSGFSPRQVA